MPDLTRLPNNLDAASGTCVAIVETPEGGRSKYDYDPASGLFRLHSLLPEGMAWPLDFGFIPSTGAQDGDPQDIMVFADERCPVGALIPCRIVGAIEADQKGAHGRVRNDRILGVAAVSHLYRQVRTLDDLDRNHIDALTAFWVEKGRIEDKDFRVLGLKQAKDAVELVRLASAAARKPG
jgi:inorganic pyrophosphatase